jgi:hypothetical protein
MKDTSSGARHPSPGPGVRHPTEEDTWMPGMSEPRPRTLRTRQVASYTLRHDQLEQLRNMADVTGQSISEVVRSAIDLLMRGSGPERAVASPEPRSSDGSGRVLPFERRH